MNSTKPESLLTKHGTIRGITFLRPLLHPDGTLRRIASIRITVSRTDDTLITTGRTPEEFAAQYTRAIDRLEEMRGATFTEEQRALLESTREAFLRYYGIGLKQVTLLDFSNLTRLRGGSNE